MLNKANAFFEEQERIAEAYEAKKEALEAKKKEIIDTYGWDSDELNAWYEEKGSLTFPIEDGACKAYRAWRNSLRHENEELEMDEFLWDREVKGFVEALRKAGLSSFIYTNQSTAVMENLHQLEAEGCKMEGLTKIKRIERRFGENTEEEILGIRFTVC